MKEINDIKIILGKYEKIFSDKDTIKKTEISLELKGKIYKDLQNKSIELKKQLMCLVNQLPSINENDYAITGTLNYCKKIEEKKNPSDFDLWKKNISEQVNYIYDRNVKLLQSKEILHNIYKNMTNVYGIVWEQEFKEWRWEHVSKPTTLEIIYGNKQYKSIFDAKLEDQYYEYKDVEKLSVKDLIQPLLTINEDKSKGNCITLKRIYQHMEEEYNINWERMIKKYVKENNNTPKLKSDLLYWNHGLIEAFRISINDLIQDIKK